MKKIFLTTLLLVSAHFSFGQVKPSLIAYWSGDARKASEYNTNQLTHIIYSFLHLQGASLAFDSPDEEKNLMQLVELKKANPTLKVMISLGGWEGCKTCSDIFSSDSNRVTFVGSVKQILQRTNTDGIDLDWEYPSIPGPKGHGYKPEDRQNFTSLVQSLRQELGNKYELSFAIGGFQEALEKSIDVLAIAPWVDRINVMSYDLVSGFSVRTGHHTPLLSTKNQKESTQNAVDYLKSIGFPSHKIVIGAAFYGRAWENVPPQNNGLYQSGKFKEFIDYANMTKYLSAGFELFWDNEAQAPYAYNEQAKIFVTYDNKKSVALKASYARKERLGGVMFWVLSSDTPKDGLLHTLFKNLYPKGR